MGRVGPGWMGGTWARGGHSRACWEGAQGGHSRQTGRHLSCKEGSSCVGEAALKFDQVVEPLTVDKRAVCKRVPAGHRACVASMSLMAVTHTRTYCLVEYVVVGRAQFDMVSEQQGWHPCAKDDLKEDVQVLAVSKRVVELSYEVVSNLQEGACIRMGEQGWNRW